MVVIDPHLGGPIGHKPWPVGRSAIFTDGAPAPPVISFIASRVFSRPVNVTKVHDMTLRRWCLLQRWDFPCDGSDGQSIEGIHRRGEDEQELWKRSEGE
jgi:hypothetical protein